MTKRDYLTPNEVASLLKVSPITIRQWAQKGILEAQTTAGGHRRFSREMVERFAQGRGIEVAATAASRRPSLLIVDDNRSFNEYLAALFSVEVPGLDIHSAFDGFEAGQMVVRHQPTVVLLDVMMPGIDGTEVCRRLKEAPDTVGIRVVAMTGFYSPEIERRMLAAGAERLLKKPFSAEEVLSACGLTDITKNDPQDRMQG